MKKAIRKVSRENIPFIREDVNNLPLCMEIFDVIDLNVKRKYHNSRISISTKHQTSSFVIIGFYKPISKCISRKFNER
jgi:hypothetical protein